jgi:prepilin signal peptidase PulO-like enzyme (type II secretory pathway)
MMVEMVFLFSVRTVATLWFVRFMLNKMDIEIPKVSVVVFSLALNLYTQEERLILLGAVLFLTSEFDRREFRIPDLFTKPALYIFTILAGLDWRHLAVAWGWIALMYGFTYLAPHALGRGDVKFIGALILLSKWMTETPPQLFLALLLALASLLALPGSLLMRSRRRGYPFAPAISGATLLLL